MQKKVLSGCAKSQIWSVKWFYLGMGDGRMAISGMMYRFVYDFIILQRYNPDAIPKIYCRADIFGEVAIFRFQMVQNTLHSMLAQTSVLICWK